MFHTTHTENFCARRRSTSDIRELLKELISFMKKTIKQVVNGTKPTKNGKDQVIKQTGKMYGF